MNILQSNRAKAFAFLAIGIVGGSLAAGPLPPAFAKVFEGQQGVHPHVVFTGNSAQATVKAINNGTGYAILGQSNSSAAVFGQSVSGGGIVGLSTSGYGLTGTSASNIGLNGTSTSNSGVGGSTHADFPFAGVFGTSLSPDSNAVGVSGAQGVNGFGVAGTCNTGNTGLCTGVTGETLGTNGVALSAFGANAAPSSGYTPAPAVNIDAFGGGPAMQVLVAATTAPVLTIDGNGSVNITAGNNARPLNVFASGVSGDSVDAATGGSAGEAFLGQASGTGATIDGFGGGAAALFVGTFGGAPEMIAHDYLSCLCDVMSLDSSGNMILLGGLTTFGTPLIRTKTVTGHPVGTYAPQQAEPTVEDVGQGQLVNGEAAIRIDPAFGNTMDSRRSYLVFITPDGDSRGLYTTQKTPTGFVVRENGGGRSSLAFDYRIVGKPFGSTAARLPAVQGAMRGTSSEVIAGQRALNAKLHPNLPQAYRVRPLPRLAVPKI